MTKYKDRIGATKSITCHIVQAAENTLKCVKSLQETMLSNLLTKSSCNQRMVIVLTM